MASATRDSSPPDAMRASGRAGSPGLGANVKTTSSIPVASNCHGVAIDLDGRAPAPPAAGATATRNWVRREPEPDQAPPPSADSALGRRRRPLVDRIAAASGRPREQGRASSAARAARARHRGRAAGPPRRPSLAVLDDGRLVVAVAPLQGEDHAEAVPRGRASVARVVVDLLDQRARLGGDVLELGLEPGEPLGEPAQRPSNRATSRGCPLGAGDRARGRPARFRRAASRATSAAPAAIVSPCCAVPSCARISAASPARSPAASISAASCSASSSRRSELARVERPARGAPPRSPATPRRPRRPSRAPRQWPPIGVEQVALPTLVEQPLLIVLAVDLDQRPGRLGEPRRGDRLVVQPGRRAAVRADLADGRSAAPAARSNSASTPRALGTVADERSRRRARPAPGRARRSAGSCRRRSRR